MRVLFYNWEYPPQGSGIGRYNELLTKALRRSGHFCVVVTSTTRGCPKIEKLDGGVVYRLCQKEEMGSSHQVKSVIDLAKEFRVDLIEGADHLGHCASLLQKSDRPPVCIKMHYNDVLYDLRYAQAAYKWQRVLIWLACVRQYKRIEAERYSIEEADFLTAPSKEIFLKAQQQGLRLPEKRRVIPNPVESPEYWTNEEATNPTLLLVGRVDFGKGVQYLPQLLNGIRENFPSVTLEIAGEDCFAKGIGSMFQWLERRVGNTTVRYLGLLDRKELDKAYSRAWIILAPSKWDTFPNVVLEAMIRSKAIATSSFGGAKEMLQGTGNVVGIPDNENFIKSICCLLADSDLRKRVGEQGRNRAEQEYSLIHIAQEYVAWFEKVL